MLCRVIIATIVQLAFLDSSLSSQDFTLHIWPYMICTGCVQALSIITACIPYLKPFLESLQAGAMRADDARTRQFKTTNLSGVKNNTTRRAYLKITRESDTAIPLKETRGTTNSKHIGTETGGYYGEAE